MSRPDGNGNWDDPPAGDGLPDLPAEWGHIVVPDDASALHREAEQIRRELRDGRSGPAESGSLSLRQITIFMIASVLITLAGLAGVTWSERATSTALRSEPASPGPAAAALVGRPLPALELTGTRQEPVSLRGLRPAIILLTQECACADAVADAVAAAPAGVTVVAVAGDSTSAPAISPQTGDVPVRALADPAGELRELLGFTPAGGTTTAVLVNATGTVIRVLPALGSAEEYRADLPLLAG